MKRLLTGLFVLIALAVSALAVLWSVGRLRPPPPEHANALALMEQPWQPPGENAVEGLWLMDYAIPSATERRRVFQDDLRRMRTLPDPAERYRATMQSSAEGQHPRHAWADGDPARFCKSNDDCLAKVRTELSAYRELVARNQAALQQIAQADEGAHLQTVFSGAPAHISPGYQRAYYPATELAVRFADGERIPALEQTCRHIVRWRDLAANSDTLSGALIGQAFASRGYARLAASMLAEIPVNAALPEPCAHAFRAPETAEAGALCTAMRGDHRLMPLHLQPGDEAQWETLYDQLDPHMVWLRLLPRRISYDESKTRARVAAGMAHVCTPDHIANIAQDVASTPPPAQAPSSPMQRVMACADNLLGCEMAELVASTSMSEFAATRIRDAHAHYRMLAALVWMRARADATADPAAALARLPEGLNTAAHPLRYLPEQRALQMPLLQTVSGTPAQPVTMPIAGSRVAAAAPRPVSGAAAQEAAESPAAAASTQPVQGGQGQVPPASEGAGARP